MIKTDWKIQKIHFQEIVNYNVIFKKNYFYIIEAFINY